MKNRSRLAAKVTGAIAAGALLLGAVGPAEAASQNVSYAIVPGQATITLPTTPDPLVFTLPDSTGVTGTWDDATGAFTGNFTSAEYSSTRSVTAPIAGDITQRTQFTAPAGVNGNIDPATGTGTLTASYTTTVVLESILIGGTTLLVIDFTCTITGVNVTYNVVATGLGGSSVIPTNLALTATGISVPTGTCVAGPNATLPQATIQDGFNTGLGLPTTGASSSVNLVAGAIAPPPSTTTTTIPPTTTTTAPAEEEADPASAVTTNASFTG